MMPDRLQAIAWRRFLRSSFLYFFLKAGDEMPLGSRFVLSAFGPMDGIKQPTFPIKSLPFFPLPREPKGQHDYRAAGRLLVFTGHCSVSS